MPPPNITGKLHLGHAAFLSIQDSLIRYYRKQGYSTLWLPGTDHAGLATHDKIIAALDNENYTREAYLSKGEEIKDQNHESITEQIKALGSSCDWTREQYTLNDNFKKAARHALNELNRNELLYKKNGQWYIKMADMCHDLLQHILSGGLIINDEGELNKLIHMLKNPEDWCISRQIYWGYQIPIFFDENDNFCIAETDCQAKTLLATDKIHQEESTFDTWFTSSLWPFAALGWPENTKDYNKYYPAQMIETAEDILFFWCARMLMMGKFLTGIYPFKEIYLHGIFRDKKGQKMSKSLGNGIDPLDIIDKYGTDALRFCILSKSSNKDMKIDESEFRDAQKFINKIWQSARFFDMQIQKNPKYAFSLKKSEELDFAPIIALKDNFIKSMEKRDFLNITRNIQHSFKHDFCDTWIEKYKQEIWDGNEKTINSGLNILYAYLNLLHCFIPFITESLSLYFFDQSLLNSEF